MRDLAHRLLTLEAGLGRPSEATESRTARVYEKLRISLVEFVGLAGFQSLASRALTLAKLEAPALGAARIASDGTLHGFSTTGPQVQMDQAQASEAGVEAGIQLVASLLGLLRMFLGEALTLSLLRNAWPGEDFGDSNAVNGRKA